MRKETGEQLAFHTRPACEVCASGSYEILYECPFDVDPLRTFLDSYYAGRITIANLTGSVYSIRRCRLCGFLWQGDVLGEAGVEKLYEHWIDPDESLEKTRRLGAFERARLAHQVALAACLLRRAPHEVRALDFGMGWGLWCEAARTFGFVVSGSELSARRAEYVRSRGLDVVTNLLESDGRFDLINSEQVFEHVAEPGQVLRALAARLAAGGLLRISVPDASRFLREFAAGKWRPAKDALHPLEHINGFTHATLIRLAGGAGLRPVGLVRFVAAHGRAASRGLARNPRALVESLYGHLWGLAMWFEHAEPG